MALFSFALPRPTKAPQGPVRTLVKLAAGFSMIAVVTTNFLGVSELGQIMAGLAAFGLGGLLGLMAQMAQHAYHEEAHHY